VNLPALLLTALALTAPVDPPTAKREELFRNLTKNRSTGAPIELKALEIRAKIYEPQVIYVLDRSKIDIDFREEPVKFAPRIEDPIRGNGFR
jgi:hypothetical protein